MSEMEDLKRRFGVRKRPDTKEHSENNFV